MAVMACRSSRSVRVVATLLVLLTATVIQRAGRTVIPVVAIRCDRLLVVGGGVGG